MRDSVALVARDADTRSRITAYLADAGFAIEAFADTPPISSPTVSAVWIVDRDDEVRAVSDLIRPWLIARARRRVVILTWRPSSVRDVLESDADRLAVLVPPVFPWQIIDALRAPGGRW